MTISPARSGGAVVARVARRTAGGAATAAGVTWTSGLEPAGSVVTSLIRRPATSGPDDAGGELPRGVVRRGRGCATGR